MKNKKRLQNQAQADITRETYQSKLLKANALLFNYYKAQGIIPEDEWEQYTHTLKLPLPSSFRIQLSLPERDLILKYMEERFFCELSQIANSDENDGVSVPRPIPFVPYAFQTDMPRAALRSHPVLRNMHEFLVNETAIVPPLLLDIQSHHLVLDACASPGSKTMQMIELMNCDNLNPDGLIVANDIDYNRCYLLVHQTLKRLPTANCVVVNHDASLMPAILDANQKPVLFDRILCDVICSGDGTFRKNPEMWATWDPQKAINLHKVQQHIAKRCLQLLKVGGLMAYSTCSLNPIEDEAVVAHMLRLFGENIELVDVSDKLPGLKRSPGISSWKVFTKTMEVVNSHAESNKSVFAPSMFPPTDDERVRMHLHRTFRILPHAQNSGGFYVAIIRKIGEFHDELRVDQPLRKPLQKKRKTFREDPFVFLDNGNADILKQQLKEHFGVSGEFPYGNLLVRTHNTEKKKGIYFVNDRLRDMMKNNENRFKIVNAGIGVLRSVEEKVCRCGYRLMQDGIRILLPHIRQRVVEIEEKDVVAILQGMDEKAYTPLDLLQSADTFKDLEAGSVVLRCIKGNFRKHICCWMGCKTISAFVTREEKIHILNMLGADSKQLCKTILSVRQEKAAAARGLLSINEENPAMKKEADEEAVDSHELTFIEDQIVKQETIKDEMI